MSKKHDELIKILKEDHQEVKAIFTKLVKEKEAAGREKLVKKLHQEIEPHLAGEEAAFYPALKKTDQGRETALESLEEHQVARAVLQELMALAGSHETFKAKATVLQELVAHHIEEEENKAFKLFKKMLKYEEAEEVLQKFQQVKNRRQEEMEKELAMAA